MNEQRCVYSICRDYPPLDHKELRIWSSLYREYGEEVFTTTQEFDVSLCKAIVEDMIANGLSLTQTCVKYRITSRSRLRNWTRRYSLNKMKEKRIIKSQSERPISRSQEDKTT